jgi:glycine cleavage system H protein
MSKIPENLRYTKDHEWAEQRGGTVRIGITDFAQASLGDVVMVELPKVGDTLTAGKAFGSVESPKSVSDLYAPVSGTVTAINEALDGNPEKVNEDPYGDGWIVEMTPASEADLESLLDAAAYGAHLEALDH